MHRINHRLLLYSLLPGSAVLRGTTRNSSFFNRLVKTEQHRVYRVSSPISQKIPGSVFLNRIAFQLHQLLKQQDGEEKIKMPTRPPESVRGMKILDREAFKTVVQVPSIEVPFAHIGALQKHVKKYLFKMIGVRPVAEAASYAINRDNHRLFLLDPDKFTEASDVTKVFGSQLNLSDFGVDLSSWRILDVNLTYKNWHYDDVLGAVLPIDSDGIGGFSSIGHIVHLNMKDDLHEYKKIIGEVLLDKVPSAETVVNKTNTIDNTFRNFSMEVLAGKDEFVAVAKENGLSFQMDFSKVYWNPRLGTEHQRIISQLKANDIVYDVFAGIGPFSSPAVRKGCVVFANDLNPESFKWLKVNMKPKKVSALPQLYNLDGREFIKTVVREDLTKRWQGSDSESKSVGRIHIVMNLPALAIEFLDAFRGLLSDIELDPNNEVPLPNIHCYSFSKESDAVADIKQRVETVIGAALPEEHNIRIVRNVAPNKEMLCAEFALQKEVLMSKDAEITEPPSKKTKTEDVSPDS